MTVNHTIHNVVEALTLAYFFCYWCVKFLTSFLLYLCVPFFSNRKLFYLLFAKRACLNWHLYSLGSALEALAHECEKQSGILVLFVVCCVSDKIPQPRFMHLRTDKPLNCIGKWTINADSAFNQVSIDLSWKRYCQATNDVHQHYFHRRKKLHKETQFWAYVRSSKFNFDVPTKAAEISVATAFSIAQNITNHLICNFRPKPFRLRTFHEWNKVYFELSQVIVLP